MTYNQVVVYVSNNCSQSEAMLSFLDQWNITYKKKNISVNREALKELQRKSIYTTPAIMVNNSTVLGFQENTLTRELGLRRK